MGYFMCRGFDLLSDRALLSEADDSKYLTKNVSQTESFHARITHMT